MRTDLTPGEIDFLESRLYEVIPARFDDRRKLISLYKQPPTGMLGGWLKLQRTSREANATAVLTRAAAGAVMVPGTDGGNPTAVQGYSVHRELRLLVEAGLSPWATRGRW